MTLRSLLFATRWLAVAMFASTALVLGASAVNASTHDGDRGTSRVQEPPAQCFADREGAPTPAPQAGAVNVAIVVPAVTRMRLGQHDEVTSVATNSGCAPRSSDDFIVENNSSFAVATTETAAAALACSTHGSWEDTSAWHDCQ